MAGVQPFWVVEEDPDSDDLLVISNDPSRPVVRLEPYNKNSPVDTGYAQMMCNLLNRGEELLTLALAQKPKKKGKKRGADEGHKRARKGAADSR